MAWLTSMMSLHGEYEADNPYQCTTHLQTVQFQPTLIKSDVFLSTLPVCFMTRTLLSSLELDRDLKRTSCPDKERSRCQNGSCLFVTWCHLAEKKVAKEMTLKKFCLFSRSAFSIFLTALCLINIALCKIKPWQLGQRWKKSWFGIT